MKIPICPQLNTRKEIASTLARGCYFFLLLSSPCLSMYDKAAKTSLLLIAMEEYIKCTLPNEWMGSWNADALKAGAYCVKMVGWYRTLKPVSSTGGYHVTQGTQNYIESSNYSTTDSAVNAI